MEKRYFFISITCLTLFILIGCVTTIQTYEPKTPDELPIKELLINWETTWNSHDVNGNLVLYNDKARIMYGKDRKIATKAEYVEILPERMKAHPSIKLGTPRIEVSGDKADVWVSMSMGSFKSQTTFHLAMENSTWSIMSWKY
jgi:hypothetical protein